MDVMLLRSIQSVFEVDSNGCYNVASRASGKLIEMERRSMHSVLELLEMDVMLLRSIQRVFEVASNGCYNVGSRASGKLIEMDVATKIPAFAVA